VNGEAVMRTMGVRASTEIIISLGIAALLAAPVQAQRPAAEFDVASIKIHNPEALDGGMKINPDGIDYRRVTLYECVRAAYQMSGFQLSSADALVERTDM
jgi:hypothetical protein